MARQGEGRSMPRSRGRVTRRITERVLQTSHMSRPNFGIWPDRSGWPGQKLKL
ncbi:hypothetical protein FRUB_08175 [Fimbriiglobus ruber]|uniref:Uncharacterized protein n=1 Tax=Fimbriiglobus ruber TaxID=1908690 RepID=A0A225D261_9BACT|nr:hypothetical protein FRUB_08175 [Fimbriiglobus ruber]